MTRKFTFFVLCAAVFSASAASAQEDVDGSRRNAIVRAVELISPTVVTVNVLDIQYERVVDPSFENFFRLFDVPRGGPGTRLRERPVRGVGSGFIFDSRGFIITNFHVVQNADEVSVTLSDGRNLHVQFVGGDERNDIAVLKANAEGLPVAKLGDSDDLLIGEWMIAIGNPFGLLVRDPNPTVSLGVVSANHRRVSRSIGAGERLYQDMIQTDAAINPGNSGGPLVNSLGEVVGVNAFIFSPSGGNIGLGFAIPINRVKRVADEIIGHGRRLDPWPGFLIVSVEEGVMVSRLLEDCPARSAGLAPQDLVIAFNGEPVTHPSDLDFAFWGAFVGDRVTLTVKRESRTFDLSFEIEELRQR